MEFNYMRAEFNRVVTDDVDAQNYRLKLSSGVGDTRWLNVSAESFEAIRNLLIAAEDAETNPPHPGYKYTCTDCKREILTGSEEWATVELDGVWVEQSRHKGCIAGLYYVARDGAKVSPYFKHESLTHAWLQRHQPMSNDWAVQHEGYSFEIAEPPAWTCFDCQTVQPGGTVGVWVLEQYEVGLWRGVANPDGSKAVRCMGCENKIQHPA